jgi:hypothetical protein
VQRALMAASCTRNVGLSVNQAIAPSCHVTGSPAGAVRALLLRSTRKRRSRRHCSSSFPSPAGVSRASAQTAPSGVISTRPRAGSRLPPLVGSERRRGVWSLPVPRPGAGLACCGP